MEELTGHIDRLGLSFDDWLPIASPTFTWTWRHLAFIRRQCDRVDTGEIDRLLVTVPPRHGKSEQITVRRPAWKLENDPTWRTIVGCHTQRLANKFSRKTRRICRERGVALSRESSAVEDWETMAGGGHKAAGVGVAVAGSGANEVIIDDPVKNRQEANSPTMQEGVFEWYRDDICTRLEPDASIILQLTRWHVSDLAGKILDSEDGAQWTVLNLPAFAEEDDPMGRQLGEALCPERYDEAKLARIKGILGNSFFALFQGRPVAQSGNLIKREWLRYYKTPPADPEVVLTVQSWDTASKFSESENAPAVCHTWKVTKDRYYLIDEFRDWLPYPDLKRAAISKAEQFGPNMVLIEEKASGAALIQDLQRSTSLPVLAVLPLTDKETRFSAQTTCYEAGLVMHPESAPWLADHEAELLSFPYGAYKDRCDAVSQFLAWAFVNARRFNFEASGIARITAGIGQGGRDQLNDFAFGGRPRARAADHFAGF